MRGKRRTYHPHPGNVPTRDASRRRWIRPAPVSGKTLGEEPYSNYPEDARSGRGAFEYAVLPKEGETHAELVARVMDSGMLRISAAHTVALGLSGIDHLEEGRKTVRLAELLLHHDAAVFKSDPSPVRGKLTDCKTTEDFARISPSLAVNLSALRSLRWSSSLRPSDLALLWILIASAVTGTSPPDNGALKRVFGLSRPRDNYRSLLCGRFSLKDDPALPAQAWLIEEPIIVDNRLNPKLIVSIKPRAKGEHYAYLEHRVVCQLTASWQEQALRGLMSASLRAGIYWSKGGKAIWALDVDEAEELFAARNFGTARLGKERLAVLRDLLAKAFKEPSLAENVEWSPKSLAPIKLPDPRASRFRFDFNVERSANERGRPANQISIRLSVAPANRHEQSVGRFSTARNEDRAARMINAKHNISGLGKALTPEQRRSRRSEAAKKGWAVRANGGKQTNDGVRRPTPSDLAHARSLEDIPFFLRAQDPPKERSVYLPLVPKSDTTPEEAYGEKEEEVVHDWDAVLVKYYNRL